MIEPAMLFAGRYDLGPLIGRGGMAEVRAGVDVRLDRPVALKLLLSEFSAHPEIRRRFESEARLAARLSHPNVVAVYDSGEAYGTPFIVMERLPGTTLKDRLAAGRLAPEEARALGLQVLSALAAAHSEGIIHRDIKPGNVLAAGPGRWKVGDFGIAKTLEVGGSDDTVTGMVIGTPAYLAPERLYGGAATVASDLFSLGVVLYVALTGEKSVRDGEGAPVPLAKLRPDLDPALAGSVDRSMSPAPGDRFASAQAMAAALDPTLVTEAGAAPTVVLPASRPGWPLLLGDRHLTRVVVAVLAVAAGLTIAGLGFGLGHGATKGPGPAPASATTTTTPPTTTPPTSAPAPAVTPPPGPAIRGGGGGGKGHGDGDGG